MSILAEIVKAKREEVERQKLDARIEELIRRADEAEPARGLSAAIKKPNALALIAEMKKASPSRGVIREKLDAGATAALFESCGASAVSVLTEKRFFRGELSYVAEAKRSCGIPVLRKDFIIDSYQVYESRAAGADALLLIASILSGEEVRDFLKLSRGLGMECLVEVHNEEDLDKALESGADVIGINNRDLVTFRTDKDVTARLIRSVPPENIKVSESGIKDRKDAMFVRSLGVDAILVGEAIMESRDMGLKVKELAGA